MTRRPVTPTLHDDPPYLVRTCQPCTDGFHEVCDGTVLEAWGQYAACGCDCGGGVEAWREGL